MVQEIGGLRRIRKRGTDRVGLSMMLILTTYNLVRMGNCWEATCERTGDRVSGTP